MPSQQCLLRLQRLDLLRRRQGFHAIRVAGSVGKSSTTWLLSKLFARFKLPWGRFGPPCLGPETDTIEVNGHGLSHDTFLNHKTTLTWLFEKKTDAMLAHRAMLLSHHTHPSPTHELAHLSFATTDFELGALQHVHNHDALSPDELLTAVAIREFMTNRAVNFGLFHTLTAFGAHDCTDILTDYLATALSRIDSPVDKEVLAQSIPTLVRTYGRVMRRDVPCVLDSTNHPVVIEALFRYAHSVGTSLILNDNPNHDALRPYWPAVKSVLESGKHASALRPFEKQNILTALATFGLAMSRDCHAYTFKDPPDYPQLCHELMSLVALQPPTPHHCQWLDTSGQFSDSRILFDRASTPLAALALGQSVNSTLRCSPQPYRVDSTMDVKSLRSLPVTWIVAFSSHEGPNLVDFLRPLVHHSDNICYLSPTSGGMLGKPPISCLADLESVLGKIFGGQLKWSGQGSVISYERSIEEAKTWAINVAEGRPIVITGSADVVRSFRSHGLRLPQVRLGTRSGNGRLQDKNRNTLLNSIADFDNAEGHDQILTKPSLNDTLMIVAHRNCLPAVGQSIIDRFGRSVSGDYLGGSEKHPTSTRIWAAGTAAIAARRTLSVASDRRSVSTLASELCHEPLPSTVPQTGPQPHVDHGNLEPEDSAMNVTTSVEPERKKYSQPSKHVRLERRRQRESNPTPRRAARSAAIKAEDRMDPTMRGEGTMLDHEVYMAMVKKKHPESTWTAALEKAPQAEQTTEGLVHQSPVPRARLAAAVSPPVTVAKPQSVFQAVLATGSSLSPQSSTVATGERCEPSRATRSGIIGREAAMGLISKGNAEHQKDGAGKQYVALEQFTQKHSGPSFGKSTNRISRADFNVMSTSTVVTHQSTIAGASKTSKASSNTAGRVDSAAFKGLIAGSGIAQLAPTLRASSLSRAAKVYSDLASRLDPADFKAMITSASVTRQAPTVDSKSSALVSESAGNTNSKTFHATMLPGSRFSPQLTGRTDPKDFKLAMMARSDRLPQHSGSLATSVPQRPEERLGTDVSTPNRTGRVDYKDFMMNRAGDQLAQLQKRGSASVFQLPGKRSRTQSPTPNNSGRIEPEEFLAKMDKYSSALQKLSRPVRPTGMSATSPAQPDVKDFLKRMFPGPAQPRNIVSVPSKLDRIGSGGNSITNLESKRGHNPPSTPSKTGRVEPQDFLAMLTGGKRQARIPKLTSSSPSRSMKTANTEGTLPVAGRVLQDIKAMFTDARAPVQRTKSGQMLKGR